MITIRTQYYQPFDADFNRDVPAEGYGGWKVAELPLELEHTALVVMHAWDCGVREQYPCWYHHQTLSLIAFWFLIQETRRGEETHPGNHRSTNTQHVGHTVASGLRPRTSRMADALCAAKKQTPRVGALPSLQTT